MTVAVPWAITNATGTRHGLPCRIAVEEVIDADLHHEGQRVQHDTATNRALLGGAWNVHRRLIR